jgi:hypothetical protein
MPVPRSFIVKPMETASLISRIVSETFVSTVEVHEEIGSTNDRALQLARARDVKRP